MDDHEKRRREVYSAALAMLLKYVQISKKANEYGVGIPFYRAEIHFIEFIGENPNKNVKEIAEHFDITDAAASQMLSKLEKKGAVRKLFSKNNKRDVLISLTPLGQRAYEGHVEYHKRNRNTYLDVFDSMNLQEQQAVIRFLRSYTEAMENNIE